jgi:hypothetical protein
MGTILLSQSTVHAICHYRAHDFERGAAIGARGLYVKHFLSIHNSKPFIVEEKAFIRGKVGTPQRYI